MAREIMAEKLIGLLAEVRSSEIDALTAKNKLNEAYGYATDFAGRVKISNPGSVISWINCLMDMIVSNRDITSNDISHYCKIVLDILDPDFEERFTHPAPGHLAAF